MNKVSTRQELSNVINEILDAIEARSLVDAAIRLYEQDLEEMTSTSATPGYLTPRAFAGNAPEGKALMVKRSVGSTGWLHTDDGLEDVEEGADQLVREGRSRFHELKNDQDRTGQQKISHEIRSIKKALRDLYRSLKTVRKYKNEVGYSGESFKKQTLKDIYRMEEMMLRISESLREIKS